MKNIYIVYETDAWLSYSSRDLIGVCTTHHKAVNIAKMHAKKHSKRLSRDDKSNLENISQTQGLEYNYYIEEVQTDKLL